MVTSIPRWQYHEEAWTYDPDADAMNVDNKVIRVPLPKPKPNKAITMEIRVTDIRPLRACCGAMGG